MAQGPRATFDREFSAVQDDLLRLGDMVDQAIGKSLDCLQRRDRAMAEQVVGEDQAINQPRFEIEEACLALIAPQHPAAGVSRR